MLHIFLCFTVLFSQHSCSLKTLHELSCHEFRYVDFLLILILRPGEPAPRPDRLARGPPGPARHRPRHALGRGAHVRVRAVGGAGAARRAAHRGPQE